MTERELKQLPRLELHDRNGQLLRVTYTRSMAYYNGLKRQAEEIGGTLQVEQKRPQSITVTSAARKWNDCF